MTKYCTDSIYTDSSYGYNGFVDDKTELDPEDDAAYVNWGENWRMPTYDQLNELKTKCSWTLSTQNDVNGYLVTGPNGNTLFLPDAGQRWGSALYTSGHYWSREIDFFYPDVAYYLLFNSRYVLLSYCSRDQGSTVRAVRVSQN